MGTLPMQDVAQACQEMRYAIDKLGMRAFEVCTSVNGRDLDGEEFRPLWSLACDLEVLVFLHPPVQQIGSERLGDYFLNNLVGNPTETTVAAARLILSGVPKAFPHVKCLLAHGGGFLPYQLGRLDHGHRFVPATRSVVREPPSSFASWFFYDTILFDDRALAYLLDVVGPSRVVLGSDYPFEMCDEEAVARVQRTNLDAATLASVLGATTQRLLTGPAVTGEPAPEEPDREPPAIGTPRGIQ
jgi:aminocarboxymuconate-semialdehyde decarboxylase